jgi:hypothetical protein
MKLLFFNHEVIFKGGSWADFLNALTIPNREIKGCKIFSSSTGIFIMICSPLLIFYFI